MIYCYPHFVCSVGTFEPFATMRFELLERTVRSMRVAFPDDALFIFDNGSTDGSHDAVAQLAKSVDAFFIKRDHRLESMQLFGKRGRYARHVDDDNRTPGAARACLHEWFQEIRNGNEIAVLSDDDVEWHADARSRLRDVWHHAGDKLQIVCGFLEPEWEWNKPIKAVDVGGERLLLRESAPGSAWTIPVDRLRRCGPINPTFSYDVETCKWLRESGLDIGQIDLADHIGWNGSSYGNRAMDFAMPLDRKRWRI